MGWNEIERHASSSAVRGHRKRTRNAYFVHSFRDEARDCAAHLLATTDYGGPVTAAVGRDNIVGTQFHPEKSQAVGLQAAGQFSALEAMIIFPAIDLKDGQCVRLKRGVMEDATVFNADPAAQAKSFAAQGFRWLHCVDLNGAFDGHERQYRRHQSHPRRDRLCPFNWAAASAIAPAVEAWLDAGITRVILGTAALTNPVFVKEAARAYPGRIVVGRRRQGRQDRDPGLGRSQRI